MTIYEDPSYPENFIFPASRLPNATEIPKTLKPEDFVGLLCKIYFASLERKLSITSRI